VPSANPTIAQYVGDCVVREHRRQAVGADQDAVAGIETDAQLVDLDGSETERSSEEMPLWVMRRSGATQVTEVDEFCYDGVILGQLAHRPVVEEVGAAVADVAHAKRGLAVELSQRHGRSHAAQAGVVLDEFDDGLICRSNPFSDPDLVVEPVGRRCLRGESAGDVPGDVPTHAVGDADQQWTFRRSGVGREHRVLVAFPHTALVGSGRPDVLHLTSRIVFPI
jgi:hypothetical protein